MQVYFDLEKKTLTTKSNNDIYEGSINANKLEVFVKVTDNTQQLYNSAFFSITALMSNGRKIGHFTHDGVINSTIIDGDYYNILTFTLTKENGYTLSAGILNVTLWLNVTDSNAQLVSREAVGNILINVKETTQVDDNILIVGASGETIYNFQTAIIAIQDSQSKLSLQLTDFGDRIGDIEEKMIKNLGTISGYTDLNDILEVGYYIFSLYSESSGTTYLNIMEVESTDSYVLQTILKIGIDQPSIMKRTYTISSKAWTTSSDTFVMMSHIQDNLNSKSKQFPLSANQGRILNEKITNLENNSFNKDYNDLINKPTIPNDTIQLTNSAGFVTKTVSNLTNYYLKNETYTKNEVAQLLSTISSLSIKVVEGLPTTNISTNSIYLVRKTTTTTTNIYDEYIYINGSWEKIGDTQINLDGYAKVDDIPTKISQLEIDVELGSITDLGKIQNYNELNNVKEIGYYIFTTQNGNYINLMEVELISTYYVLQTILRWGAETPAIIKRKYAINQNTWTTTEQVITLSTDIIDKLDSNVTNKPLSANQGRILKENITETNTNVLNLDNRVKTLESNQSSGSNGGNAESVNLNRKIPVPNLFGASEIYFDTSKSIAEVVNVLRQLEYYEGNYVICEHTTRGWYNFCVSHNTDEDYFKIYFENDDADWVLFDNIDGWSSENIVNGKFEIPTKFKGGGCNSSYGLQNNLLLDFIWCEESVYVPQKDTVSIDDINMEFEYIDDDYREYIFDFIGETLQNKNVILDITKYLQNGEENKIDQFVIHTNVPKNCKMTIILPNSFSNITIFEMFMFNIVDNIHFRNDTLNHVGEEGVHHPFWTDNVFSLYNMDEEYNYLYFIVIEWDADGFATINLLQDYEF